MNPRQTEELLLLLLIIVLDVWFYYGAPISQYSHVCKAILASSHLLLYASFSLHDFPVLFWFNDLYHLNKSLIERFLYGMTKRELLLDFFLILQLYIINNKNSH